MKVIFLDKFSKDLDKIKDNKARQSIKKAILKVEKAPFLKKITGLNALKGRKEPTGYVWGIIVSVSIFRAILWKWQGSPTGKIFMMYFRKIK